MLVGCGPSYTITPPATPMGQACIIQCQSSSDQCRMQQQQAIQQCQWRNQVAEANYQRCAANNPDNALMACTKQTETCPLFTTAECDARYRQCYAACGGGVHEVPSK
ncbi:MAG: hypothetical protein U0802_16645 [Candidatus Binatia bacterium]